MNSKRHRVKHEGKGNPRYITEAKWIKKNLKTCVLCGYASKKRAIEYAKSKDELTEGDYAEIFRINEAGERFKARHIGRTNAKVTEIT